MKHVCFVLAAWTVLLAPTGSAQLPPPSQPLSIAGAVTHVYKSIDGIELRLHVFGPAPASPTARAAIVFFFGARAWTIGSVEQFAPQARHFVSRGMVPILADYRVFDRHGTTPFEAMADARSAIRWVRSRAEQLGVDPHRIVASGGSSGGHLALSAAVFAGAHDPQEDRSISARPDALVLFNPTVDTSTSVAFHARVPGREREGSPIHHLGRGLPPTVIFHGKDDTTIPYADAERFCAQARGFGDRCEVFGYDDAEHGFFNPQVENGKWHRETQYEADRFLSSIGFIAPPAPKQ